MPESRKPFKPIKPQLKPGEDEPKPLPAEDLAELLPDVNGLRQRLDVDPRGLADRVYERAAANAKLGDFSTKLSAEGIRAHRHAVDLLDLLTRAIRRDKFTPKNPEDFKEKLWAVADAVAGTRAHFEKHLKEQFGASRHPKESDFLKHLSNVEAAAREVHRNVGLFHGPSRTTS